MGIRRGSSQASGRPSRDSVQAKIKGGSNASSGDRRIEARTLSRIIVTWEMSATRSVNLVRMVAEPVTRRMICRLHECGGRGQS